jgi:hypothetical protein
VPSEEIKEIDMQEYLVKYQTYIGLPKSLTAPSQAVLLTCNRYPQKPRRPQESQFPWPVNFKAQHTLPNSVIQLPLLVKVRGKQKLFSS